MEQVDVFQYPEVAGILKPFDPPLDGEWANYEAQRLIFGGQEAETHDSQLALDSRFFAFRSQEIHTRLKHMSPNKRLDTTQEWLCFLGTCANILMFSRMVVQKAS